jgi:hypothetical protein
MEIGMGVTRDQFEVNDEGVTHQPTGYNFKPDPRSPTDGTVNRGQPGNQPVNGECYRPDEVEEMAKRLWWEYLAKIW